ncbi:MAG: beta-N-acetylhexosaminidase [Geminicoccaceae bacterium]
MSPGRREGQQRRSEAIAAIVGVAGTELDAAEHALFEEYRPAGFILFGRNCETPDQVTALVRDLRASISHPEAPVLIDQEGGRVARMKPPHWQALPPARAIGALAKYDLDAAKDAARLHARLIAADLEPLGITVNCAPVLDLGFTGQTEAIGDRAFSDSPDFVASLGRAAIEGFFAGGVLPVIKHLPGHGRATVDSHKDLPCVKVDADHLACADWLPFKANADAPFGMTAHILYNQLDPAACATHSASIIRDVIRGEIGFEGALLSDDLSMQALGGALGDRAARSLEAGCDLALHCNGDLHEMAAVLDAAGPLEGATYDRFERALARRRAPEAFDDAAGRERLQQLLDLAGPAERAVG